MRPEAEEHCTRNELTRRRGQICILSASAVPRLLPPPTAPPPPERSKKEASALATAANVVRDMTRACVVVMRFCECASTALRWGMRVV